MYCTVLEDKQEGVYHLMKNSVEKLGSSGPANRAKKDIRTSYSKPEDIPICH